MLLFVILAVCLSGAIGADPVCMPNALRGQVYNIERNTTNSFFADFEQGRVLYTSGDDFSYFNLTTKTLTAKVNGVCNVTENVPSLEQCMPDDITPLYEWFGVDNAYPVETYIIPTDFGPWHYIELTPKNKIPIVYANVESGSKLVRVNFFLNLRIGFKSMKVFDVDFSGC